MLGIGNSTTSTSTSILTKYRHRYWYRYRCIPKNRLFRGYISVHTLSLVLGCCTFGSDYSLKASWGRSYELGTLVSGHFCPFLLAYPCKLRQVGWGASVHSHFQLFPQMFNWIQVWALAGPLKDMHRLSPKPLLCSLGCVLRVVVMLEGKPSPQSEVQSALEQVFFKDLAPFPLLKNIPTS